MKPRGDGWFFGCLFAAIAGCIIAMVVIAFGLASIAPHPSFPT
jgi:hypothetical protein